ncbi:MAG: hypothetical protein KKB02_10395 [Alphaproteobacteria bacterium]|nr:hypothetical protein [Alphaproteobacteria bacterium]
MSDTLTAFDPDESDALAKAAARDTSTYFHLRAYDLMTNEPKGWLGCTQGAAANYLRLYDDKDAASFVKYVNDGDLKYLARDTTPNDRYLGLATNSYAGWGLKGGWRNPIKLHANGSISLDPYEDASFKDRYLYLYGASVYSDYLCWSEDANNSNILSFRQE